MGFNSGFKGLMIKERKEGGGNNEGAAN